MTAPDQMSLHEVRLVGMPLQIHQRAAAHQDALQREFDVLSQADHTTDDVPQRLIALVAELQERFGGLSDAPRAELTAALERGDESIDLVYMMPVESVEACEQLGRMLDEADDYCRSGELLTLATTPEALAYRRWFLGEFIAQLGGAEPTPWERCDAQGGAPTSAESDGGAAPGGEGLSTSASAPADSSDEPDSPGSESVEVPEGWSVSESDDIAMVRPSGEIDLQTAPDLRELLQSVRSDQTREVQLDLGGVSFIDSVGLSVVISAHQRLTDDGIRFVVAVPSSLQRLFEISGLDQLLELQD